MKANRHVPWIMGAGSLGLALWLFTFWNWWHFLLACLLLWFGWESIKLAMSGSDEELQHLTGELIPQSVKRRTMDRFFGWREPKSGGRELGSAPLHFAAVCIGPHRLGDLLAEGADPNVVDQRGRTPLHHAAFYGYAESVRALLKAGADPNARDHEGWTPLNAADSGRNDRQVVELLSDAGSKKTRWMESLRFRRARRRHQALGG